MEPIQSCFVVWLCVALWGDSSHIPVQEQNQHWHNPSNNRAAPAERCLAEERNCRLSPVKNWLCHSMQLLSSAHHIVASTSTSSLMLRLEMMMHACAFLSGWPGQKDSLVISAITFVCLIRSLTTWVVWATKVWWIIILEWASQLINLREDRFHALFCQMFWQMPHEQKFVNPVMV